MTIPLTHWVHEVPRTIALTRSAELECKPDVALELGRAADGLPLALHVRREVDVRGPVVAALRVPPQDLDRGLEQALAALERATLAHTITRGIVAVGKHLYYETAAAVPELFGQTLLARTLGAVSPMVLPEDIARADTAAPTRFESSTLLNLQDLREVAHDEPAPSSSPPVTVGRDAHLWVRVGDAQAQAVPRLDERADPAARLAAARTVVFESLLAVRSARWHVTRRRDSYPSEGLFADASAYRAALRDANRIGWSISRADAVKLVAELARAVDRDWHARGRVHGDLKPGNVLLERERISAFDAVDVAEGETCAGVTEGWAAPEQILVRPVVAPTDVFTLGLMVAAALSAAIFGEERSVVVPAAGEGRRRLRLFVDPDVWVDPGLVALPTPARVAWRALLVQCLAADPARRPRRGVDLAERIDDLLRRWELPGRLPIACGPGQLELTIGEREPMWVLRDAR